MTSTFTVFICGTYSDLAIERGAALDAIQRLQLRHDSMEFFGARPERPIETCLAEVRQSNVIVVIVGHRYGSVVSGREISYSEAEYEEAWRLKIPCLVYLLNDDSRAEKDCGGQTQRQFDQLQKWKDTLKERHTIYSFQDSNELALQVAVDLSRLLGGMQSAPVAPVKTVVPSARASARFSKRFGDKERQLLHGLAVDQLGNVLLVGDFWGSLNFGGSELVSAGDRDIFLAKFDSNGEHLWSARYGDEFEQVGVGVGVDSEGSVFVASAFLGSIDFGGGRLVSKGRYNIALAKIDSSGKHIWSHSFGDTNYHVPECIAVTPSGRVAIAGRFKGVVNFGRGEIESVSKQTDIFVATFDSEGECLWAKRFGGPYEQQTRSIAVDRDGTIAVTGVFKGVVTFDAHILAEQQPSEYCGFLAKLDQDGNSLWCKRFGEPYVEQGSVVTFDETTGDLLTAGFIRNKLPTTKSVDARSVCLFARYDRAGVLRWSKTFTGVYPDSLDVAPDGRILFTGNFQNSVDFGLGTLQSAGGYDIAVAMFNPDGTPRWSKRFGDPRHQFLVSGAHCRDRSFVIAGSFHGTIDFGKGTLVATGYDGKTEGAEDVFLAIFDES